MPRPRLFQGVAARYLAILGLVLGVVVVSLFVGFPQFRAWYIEEVRLKGIEAKLGFSAELVAFPDGDCCVWRIKSLSPGGPFSRAGVRVGDLAVGYKHGFRSGFLYDIANAVDNKDVLDLVLVAEGDFYSGPRSWRSVPVATD